MKKTTSMLFTALMILSLLAVACGPTPEPEIIKETVTVKETVERVVTPTALPKAEKDTLVVAVTGDVESFDISDAGWPRSTETGVNLFDVLLMYGKQEVSPGLWIGDATVMEPMLAESWDVTDEGRTWTFHLRENAVFHNGDPVTCEDVRWSWVRRLELRGTAFKQVFFDDPDKYVCLDDHTFQMTATAGNPMMEAAQFNLQQYVYNSSLALQHTEDDEWARPWLKTNPAAGGPYMLDSVIPGQETVLVANPNWWGPAPAYDRIVFRVVPSAASRMVLLLTGAVDIAQKLSLEQLTALQGQEGVKVLSFPSGNQFYMVMQNDMAPFDNKKVRQALSYAVPYDDIIDKVFLGDATPYKAPVPWTIEGSDPSTNSYEFDLDKAKALLAEAGFPDGFKSKLGYSTANELHEKAAILIQESFAKIGVEIELEKMSPALYAETRMNRDFPMLLVEVLWWTQDPGYVVNFQYWSDSHLNFSDYNNPEVDALDAQGSTEFDAEKRLDIYRQAQAIIIDDAPEIWICHPNANVAMREDVMGYVQYVDGRFRYWELYPAE
jgi:peptide/nickel transport system substrate-binding protein